MSGAAHEPCCSCGAPLLRRGQVSDVLGFRRADSLRKAVQRGTVTLPDPVLGGGPGSPPWWCATEIESTRNGSGLERHEHECE